MSADTQQAGQANADDFINEFAMKTAAAKARQLVVRPEFADCDAEDIEQELLMYLIQKVDGYDETRSQRNTFINRVIESGAAELARSRGRQKRHPADDDGYMPSFQTPMDTVDSSHATLGDEISDADDARRLCGEVSDPFEEADRRMDLESAMDAMPAWLRESAEYLMSHNMKETAAKLGISKRAMQGRRDEIREHLRKYDLL